VYIRTLVQSGLYVSLVHNVGLVVPDVVLGRIIYPVQRALWRNTCSRSLNFGVVLVAVQLSFYTRSTHRSPL